MELLGLEKSSTSQVPGRKLVLDNNSKELLTGDDIYMYRCGVGVAMYLSQDRDDIK